MKRFLSMAFGRSTLGVGWVALVIGWSFGPEWASAQMIGVTTPFNTVSDSYYENNGVRFGFALPGGRGPGSRVVGYAGNGILLPNLQFTQNGAASAIPPFGGFDPNAGANFGFGRVGPNGGGFNLGVQLGKGSSRSLTSTTPSLMVPNGFGGSMFSGVARPFVTSYTPIVGWRGPGPVENGVTRAMRSGLLNLEYTGSETPYEPPPGTEHLESSAQYGDASVAAIKAERQARALAAEQQIARLVDEGLAHEESGDFRAARVAYRRAIRDCEDPEKTNWLRERVRFIKDR